MLLAQYSSFNEIWCTENCILDSLPGLGHFARINKKVITL